MNTVYFGSEGFAAHSEFVPTPDVVAYEPVRVDRGVTSISVSNGVAVQQTHDHQATTVSTQRSDIITIGGVTAPRQSFVNAGILPPEGDDNGPQEGPQKAVEASENPSEGEGANPDYDALRENEIDAINDAVDGIPDAALESLTANAVGVAVGSLDVSSVVSAITQVTGEDPGVAHARFQQAASAYQAQADHFLEGVGVKDIPAFYEYAKAHHRGQLQEAVTKQVYGGDMSAYRELAQRFNFKQSGYGSRG